MACHFRSLLSLHKNIPIAQTHAKQSGLDIHYKVATTYCMQTLSFEELETDCTSFTRVVKEWFF